MFRYKVRIDTKAEIMSFVAIAETLANKGISVRLENEDGTRHGNASTLLNVCETIAWDDVYIISDSNVYMSFRNFIIS